MEKTSFRKKNEKLRHLLDGMLHSSFTADTWRKFSKLFFSVLQKYFMLLESASRWKLLSNIFYAFEEKKIHEKLFLRIKMSQSSWVTSVRKSSYKYLFFNHIKRNAEREKIENFEVQFFSVCSRKFSRETFPRVYFSMDEEILSNEENFFAFLRETFASKVSHCTNEFPGLLYKKWKNLVQVSLEFQFRWRIQDQFEWISRFVVKYFRSANTIYLKFSISQLLFSNIWKKNNLEFINLKTFGSRLPRIKLFCLTFPLLIEHNLSSSTNFYIELPLP